MLRSMVTTSSRSKSISLQGFNYSTLLFCKRGNILTERLSPPLGLTRPLPPEARPMKHVHSSSVPAQEKLEKYTKVLFDGECKLCLIEISALKRFVAGRKGRNIDFVDITEPGYDPSKYSGVTYELAMTEMHVIDPAGQVLTKLDAVRHMYRATGLGWVASFTELPLVRPISDMLYVRFAEYRLRKAFDRCNDSRCSIKLHKLRQTYQKDKSS